MSADYGSPRWSTEFIDCSMPMTFDTYSACSYDCLYCFSFFQRAVSSKDYLDRKIKAVRVERIKAMFTEPDIHGGQFAGYIKDRKTFQWGGLSDQFDENEKRQGVTLELLRFFREIEYPICFSTKAVWWTDDSRYVDLFKGAKFWNVKVSIITADANNAYAIERGCPSPTERLKAIERISSWGCGGATLRLRPFIIGASNPGHRALIKVAGNAGATALSTEFFCLEARANDRLKKRYSRMSTVLGFDILNFYKTHSKGSGYQRLNRNIKRPFVDDMQDEAAKNGMRFYVSDAHFKERCANGSCCGLTENWNYNRGQFCNALVIAKKTGRVCFKDIAQSAEWMKNIQWRDATGLNTGTVERRLQFKGYSLYDFMRRAWNNPNQGNSPYKHFGGILRPTGKDDEGNLIYEFDERFA